MAVVVHSCYAGCRHVAAVVMYSCVVQVCMVQVGRCATACMAVVTSQPAAAHTGDAEHLRPPVQEVVGQHHMMSLPVSMKSACNPAQRYRAHLAAAELSHGMHHAKHQGTSTEQTLG